MIEKEVICSETLKTVSSCPCHKCVAVINMMKILKEAPEEGTDQARIFDAATAHLIFPPDEGESFEDIIKNAQK